MHPTREEDHVSRSTMPRRLLAVVLAGGALGVGVPAAIAATGGNGASGNPGTTQTAPGFVQDDSATPRDHNCPDRDGGGNGGAQQGGATTPNTGTDTTPSL